MSSSPKSQTTTSTTTVPEYLKPYMTNLAGTGNKALTDLSGRLDDGSLVAPFNPNQLQGQQSAVDIANGAGGYLPTATNLLHGVLQNNPNIDALAKSGLGALTNGSEQNVVGGSTGALDQLASERLSGPSVNTLSKFSSTPFSLNQDAKTALESGARGDYLYGNPAFDEAVQASIRANRPNVLSGFANAGAGGVSGGLSQVAQQQVASDAFARLFSDERGRQLQSANQLGGLQLAGNDQQIGAASNLGSLSLQDKATRSNAASNSGRLSLAQQSNNTAAGSQIGQLLNAERNRQIQAAQLLPNTALAGSNILNQVGGIQQGQNQSVISAPYDLLSAANQGIGSSAGLLGQTSTQPVHKNTAGGILGGGLAGAGMASSLGLSTPWGVGLTAAGGLLGAF